jgi:hypothetical protein
VVRGIWKPGTVSKKENASVNHPARQKAVGWFGWFVAT